MQPSSSAIATQPSGAAIATLLAVSLLASGCNATRFAVRRSGPVLRSTLGVLSSYRDLDMARQAAPGLLVLLEGLLASDPENPALLELLCRGLYEYAFGFLQQDYERLAEREPERAARMRLRARQQFLRVYRLGLRLLRMHGAHFDLLRTPIEEIRRQVRRLSRKAVPGIVWTAVGAGGALQLGLDEPALLQMRAGVLALLQRAAALSPGYAHALPLGALGLYYGRGLDVGGSAVRAQRYFLEAIRRTRRQYLLWLVLYARHWAWQFQSLTQETVGHGPARRVVRLVPRDRKALFVRLLQEVRRFDVDRAPAVRLPNLLAQQMAARLWPMREDFLGPDLAPRTPPARKTPSTGTAPAPRRPSPSPSRSTPHGGTP